MRLDIRDVLHGFALASLIPISLASVLVAMQPRSERIAAVFPPWWGSARILAAAAQAGRIVAFGRLPATIIVHGDRADLVDRLHAAGALFIFDSSRLAGCHAPVSESIP